MKKEIIIWDLCGGSQNSVYEALKLLNNKYIKVYTFDIVEPKREGQIQLDLTSDNVIQELEKYPKPDIIFSSPLCQSFSIILNYGKGERLGWKWDNETHKYIQRPLNEIQDIINSGANVFKKYVASKIYDNAKLGGKLITSIVNIIKHFNPKFWYIENPQTSLIWEFIKYNLDFDVPFKNKAQYSSYDITFSKKPTIFGSNINLFLKNYGIRSNVYRTWGDKIVGSSKNETGDRVRIPKLLIIDIFIEMETSLQWIK